MTSTQTHSKGPQGNAASTSQEHAQCSAKKYFQGTFNGSHSLKLFYQSWYPIPAREKTRERGVRDSTEAVTGAVSHTASSLKGVVVLVHGLGEHSGRYRSVVRGLTSAGYAVFAFDNQGHGKSEGQRGHINRWQDYRNNTQIFLRLVRQQEPTAPLFLMGHSLGGLIVLDCVLRSARSPDFQALAIRGIVVSAPPLAPSCGTVNQMRIMFARLLSGVLPCLSLKMGLDECGLSRDQNIADEIANDPLIHPYVTLRWGTETLKTIDWVKDHIDQLNLPILLTHGGDDPIIDPKGSRDIFQDIPVPNKTLTIYPGSYHEPHNDLDADIVVTDLVNWLDDCPKATVACAIDH